MAGKLGVVAGGGDLPIELYNAAVKQGRDALVLAIEGQADAAKLSGIPHKWIQLTAIGRTIDLARENDIRELVLTGDFQPWHLKAQEPDAWLSKRMPEIMSRMRLGENEVVAFLIQEIEKDGLAVVSARAFAADLFAEKGQLGAFEPDTEAWMDIVLGVEAAKAIGGLDIGQAVVVQRRTILAVEGAEGTDQLIRRSKDLQMDGPGAVLVKMRKPQQELRADPPTIGPQTMVNASDAGFRGIAIEAGAAVVVDRERTIAVADSSGLFLVAVRGAE
ncbi:MAG: UDP-2,3-diacylglucosamine diphosphatase LpxI [Alphaproteobacteria bacterium]|nr:UDP-2,3-diacylglucosamine diphosphatase LpxI [Alphaproteobacteria bacterium]